MSAAAPASTSRIPCASGRRGGLGGPTPARPEPASTAAVRRKTLARRRSRNLWGIVQGKEQNANMVKPRGVLTSRPVTSNARSHLATAATPLVTMTRGPARTALAAKRPAAPATVGPVARKIGKTSAAPSITPIAEIPSGSNATNGTDAESSTMPQLPKLPKLPKYDLKGRLEQMTKRYEWSKTNLTELSLQLDNAKSEMVITERKLHSVMKDLEKKQAEFEKQIKAQGADFEYQIATQRTAFEEQVETQRIEFETQIETHRDEIDKLSAAHSHAATDLADKIHELSKERSCNAQVRNDLQVMTERATSLEVENAEFKQKLLTQDDERRRLHNVIQDLKGNIRVFCRIRPPGRDEEMKPLASITCLGDTDLELCKTNESINAITGKATDSKQDFSYDRVFDARSTQENVFEELSHLVQSVLDGYNVCVFAYGQTGSGKTYTMQGGTGSSAGIIPRSMRQIFDYAQAHSKAGWKFEMEASFLEIYNENVVDLLNPNCKEALEIRHNEGKGVVVTNLTSLPVETYEALARLMALAHQNRTVAATDYNAHSSRSHAVTKLQLTTTHESGLRLSGTLNLVDLAGSESAKTSHVDRIGETKCINKSLSCLGNVMFALYNQDKHVPYRNSKLTFLLQSSLGGNSKTLMIVNVAPFEECFAESINSLRFAAKVKNVKMVCKRMKSFVR